MTLDYLNIADLDSDTTIDNEIEDWLEAVAGNQPWEAATIQGIWQLRSSTDYAALLYYRPDIDRMAGKFWRNLERLQEGFKTSIGKSALIIKLAENLQCMLEDKRPLFKPAIYGKFSCGGLSDLMLRKLLTVAAADVQLCAVFQRCEGAIDIDDAADPYTLASLTAFQASCEAQFAIESRPCVLCALRSRPLYQKQLASLDTTKKRLWWLRSL